MNKFRYYFISDYGDVTGTNNPDVAKAAGEEDGALVIDTETNMEISDNNPVEIAEEEGYVL